MFHTIGVCANTSNSRQGVFRAADEGFWQGVLSGRASLRAILQGAIMIPSDGSGRLMFAK